MTLKEHDSICDMLYHPKTAKHVKQMTANYIAAQASVSEAERTAKWREFTRDPKVASELCGAKLFKVMNDVLAHTFALSFLELSTLADNEWPILMNEHIDRNFTVLKIGQNGGARKKQIVERRTNVDQLMERISSEEYEFPLYNLNVGKTDQFEKAMARITYELTLKLDQLATAILDATNLSSGLRKTLNLHPAIVVANIPDANYLDLSGVNVSGKWDVEKLKRVLDYCARFSADTGDDLQDLKVKAMYMSSIQKRDFWDMCDLVATYSGASPSDVQADPKNLVPHEVRTEIWRSGQLEKMFGYEFAIVTRNTITSPYNYISTNKPVGYYWHKPSQDAVKLDNSTAMEKVNKNSIWMAQTMQMAGVNEWTRNFLKVKV